MKVINLERAVLYVSDVASLIGCSTYKIYTAIRNGKLKTHKVGRTSMITVEDFEDYVKSLGNKTNQQ